MSEATAGGLVRCAWATHSPQEAAYHDEDWGVPVTDDARLFECLTLEGAQAGLSWRTILAKREGYRRAFHEFDPEAVARMPDSAVESLVQNAEIVRHRGKIESTLSNARCVLDVLEEFGSFSAFIWSFVDGQPLQNNFEALSDLPSQTEESRGLSKALRARGFRFVGPTTCYAFMQAAGLVNDHLRTCHRHEPVKRLGLVFGKGPR